MNLETWKTVSVIAGTVTVTAAATIVIWKGCKLVRRTGLRLAKAIYLIVGREGNEELGIAPILGIEAQFALLKAGQDHANWHMGNGGPVPMHERLTAAVEETRLARAEVATLRTIIDRRLDDRGYQARGTKGQRRVEDLTPATQRRKTS